MSETAVVVSLTIDDMAERDFCRCASLREAILACARIQLRKERRRRSLVSHVHRVRQRDRRVNLVRLAPLQETRRRQSDQSERGDEP